MDLLHLERAHATLPLRVAPAAPDGTAKPAAAPAGTAAASFDIFPLVFNLLDKKARVETFDPPSPLPAACPRNRPGRGAVNLGPATVANEEPLARPRPQVALLRTGGAARSVPPRIRRFPRRAGTTRGSEVRYSPPSRSLYV